MTDRPRMRARAATHLLHEIAAGPSLRLSSMGESQTVRCPYCYETCEVWIDIDLEGSFVQDCEVCCRPWVLYVSRNEDGDVAVDVTRAQ